MGRFLSVLPEGRQPMYGELIGYEERCPPERRLTCSDCETKLLLHPETQITLERVENVAVLQITGPDPICEHITDRALQCSHRNFTLHESLDRRPLYYGGEPFFPKYYDDCDEDERY